MGVVCASAITDLPLAATLARAAATFGTCTPKIASFGQLPSVLTIPPPIGAPSPG
jgi:hypothetical protein